MATRSLERRKMHMLPASFFFSGRKLGNVLDVVQAVGPLCRRPTSRCFQLRRPNLRRFLFFNG